MSAEVVNVADAIRSFDFRYGDEDQLQEGLAAALSGQGFEVRREVRLSASDRVDLVVGRVGVEVKVAGSADSVRRQLARYAKHDDDLDGLVLVTNKLRHSPPDLPLPVEVVCLTAASL